MSGSRARVNGGQRLRVSPCTRAIAVCSPSNSTCTASRPNANSSRSPGSPLRITVFGPRRTTVSLPSGRRRTMPTGLRRKVSFPARDTPAQVTASRSGSGSRGCHPGCARRTSSWGTNISTLLTSRSSAGIRVGQNAGGPPRTRSTSSAHGLRAESSWTFLVWPGGGGSRMPAAASGRRSRTTRWAARSRVCQPVHSVGSSGPSSVNKSHNAARSSEETAMPQTVRAGRSGLVQLLGVELQVRVPVRDQAVDGPVAAVVAVVVALAAPRALGRVERGERELVAGVVGEQVRAEDHGADGLAVGAQVVRARVAQLPLGVEDVGLDDLELVRVRTVRATAGGVAPPVAQLRAGALARREPELLDLPAAPVAQRGPLGGVDRLLGGQQRTATDPSADEPGDQRHDKARDDEAGAPLRWRGGAVGAGVEMGVGRSEERRVGQEW